MFFKREDGWLKRWWRHERHRPAHGVHIASPQRWRGAAHPDSSSLTVQELIRLSGFGARSVKYLIGASLLAAVSGLLLPTAAHPLFQPLIYAQGGLHAHGIQVPVRGKSLVHPLLCRILGWLFCAGWADLIGRRTLVIWGVRLSCLTALLIAFLPRDVSMFAALTIYQIIAPTWEVNASLMQAEAAQPLSVILPLGFIGLGGTALACLIWYTGWLIADTLVIGLGAEPEFPGFAEDLQIRVTFLLCAVILFGGYLFFKFFAFESPHYLVLRQQHDQAWSALEKLCPVDEVLDGYPRHQCVLTLQHTDIEEHYLREPTLRKRLSMHFMALGEFLGSGRNQCGDGVRCDHRMIPDPPTSLSTGGPLSTPRSPMKEETPEGTDDIPSLGQEAGLSLASAKTVRQPGEQGYLLQLASTGGRIVTEAYDDHDEFPTGVLGGWYLSDDIARSPVPLVVMVSVLSAIALSVNTWAGGFWAAGLEDGQSNPKRLYIDAAGIPGALVAIFLSRCYPVSVFRQLQLCLYLLIGGTAVVLLSLATVAELPKAVRLIYAFSLVSLVGAADASAKGILIDHVPISLRASVAGFSQALALVFFSIAHCGRAWYVCLTGDGNSAREPVGLQPAVWLLSYLIAAFAPSENLLWPPPWRSSL